MDNVTIVAPQIRICAALSDLLETCIPVMYPTVRKTDCPADAEVTDYLISGV